MNVYLIEMQPYGEPGDVLAIATSSTKALKFVKAWFAESSKRHWQEPKKTKKDEKRRKTRENLL